MFSLFSQIFLLFQLPILPKKPLWISLNQINRKFYNLILSIIFFSPILLETAQFKVVKQHERKGKLAFTQGLAFKNSTTLIESVGKYHQSAIKLVSLENFEVENMTKLPDEYFGEGCTMIKNSKGDSEIYQLTWKERKMYLNIFTIKTILFLFLS